MDNTWSEDTLMQDLKVLADRISWLKGENERLQIENGLLRKASEEQRELNGQLRVEIQELEAVVKGQSYR